MVRTRPSKCLLSRPAAPSRFWIYPWRNVCWTRGTESLVSSSPHFARSLTFTATCLEIRTITRVSCRVQSEVSSLVSCEQTLQLTVLSKKSSSSGLCGPGEVTTAKSSIESPRFTRGSPRKRWLEARRKSSRSPLCTKYNIPRVCVISLLEESSTSV